MSKIPKSNQQAAESIAAMVTEWVETGIKMGTDWRNGLADTIGLRLARFKGDDQLDHADAGEANAAIATLQSQGYSYNGGQHWKPPLGQRPDFDLIDTLRAQLAAVTAPPTDFASTQQVSSVWLAQLRSEYVALGNAAQAQRAEVERLKTIIANLDATKTHTERKS